MEVIKSAIPHLPLIWLVVLAHYTWEILSSERVRNFIRHKTNQISKRKLIPAYGLAGIGLLGIYWWCLNLFFAPRIAKYEAEQREKNPPISLERKEESKKEPVKPNGSPSTSHSVKSKKPSLNNDQIDVLKRDADQACKLSRDLQQAFDSKENRDREAKNKFKNQPKAATLEEESNRTETIRLELQESQTKYDGDLSILGGQAFYQMKVLKPEIQSKDFSETEFDGWQFTFQEWQTNSFRNRNPVAASQYILKVISWLPPHGIDACSPK